MRNKLLDGVSTLPLTERRDYYPLDSYFPEDAVYIKVLGADDPLRNELPGVPSASTILYVLRSGNGEAVIVSDDKLRLISQASEGDKILYTLH